MDSKDFLIAKEYADQNLEKAKKYAEENGGGISISPSPKSSGSFSGNLWEWWEPVVNHDGSHLLVFPKDATNEPNQIWMTSYFSQNGGETWSQFELNTSTNKHWTKPVIKPKPMYSGSSIIGTEFFSVSMDSGADAEIFYANLSSLGAYSNVIATTIPALGKTGFKQMALIQGYEGSFSIVLIANKDAETGKTKVAWSNMIYGLSNPENLANLNWSFVEIPGNAEFNTFDIKDPDNYNFIPLWITSDEATSRILTSSQSSLALKTIPDGHCVKAVGYMTNGLQSLLIDRGEKNGQHVMSSTAYLCDGWSDIVSYDIGVSSAWGGAAYFGSAGFGDNAGENGRYALLYPFTESDGIAGAYVSDVTVEMSLSSPETWTEKKLPVAQKWRKPVTGVLNSGESVIFFAPEKGNVAAVSINREAFQQIDLPVSVNQKWRDPIFEPGAGFILAPYFAMPSNPNSKDKTTYDEAVFSCLSDFVLQSKDGITWNKVSLPKKTYWGDLKFDSEAQCWVIAEYKGSSFAYSFSDSQKWSQVYLSLVNFGGYIGHFSNTKKFQWIFTPLFFDVNMSYGDFCFVSDVGIQLGDMIADRVSEHNLSTYAHSAQGFIKAVNGKVSNQYLPAYLTGLENRKINDKLLTSGDFELTGETLPATKSLIDEADAATKIRPMPFDFEYSFWTTPLASSNDKFFWSVSKDGRIKISLQNLYSWQNGDSYLSLDSYASNVSILDEEWKKLYPQLLSSLFECSKSTYGTTSDKYRCGQSLNDYVSYGYFQGHAYFINQLIFDELHRPFFVYVYNNSIEIIPVAVEELCSPSMTWEVLDDGQKETNVYFCSADTSAGVTTLRAFGLKWYYYMGIQASTPKIATICDFSINSEKPAKLSMRRDYQNGVCVIYVDDFGETTSFFEAEEHTCKFFYSKTESNHAADWTGVEYTVKAGESMFRPSNIFGKGVDILERDILLADGTSSKEYWQYDASVAGNWKVLTEAPPFIDEIKLANPETTNAKFYRYIFNISDTKPGALFLSDDAFSWTEKTLPELAPDEFRRTCNWSELKTLSSSLWVLYPCYRVPNPIMSTGYERNDPTAQFLYSADNGDTWNVATMPESINIRTICYAFNNNILVQGHWQNTKSYIAMWTFSTFYEIKGAPTDWRDWYSDYYSISGSVYIFGKYMISWMPSYTGRHPNVTENDFPYTHGNRFYWSDTNVYGPYNVQYLRQQTCMGISIDGTGSLDFVIGKNGKSKPLGIFRTGAKSSMMGDQEQAIVYVNDADVPSSYFSIKTILEKNFDEKINALKDSATVTDQNASKALADLENKVDKATTVNEHPLNDNVVLTPADVGAAAATTTINGYPLSEDIQLLPSDVGAAPNTLKVNGYSLDSDLNLRGRDIALPAGAEWKRSSLIDYPYFDADAAGESETADQLNGDVVGSRFYQPQEVNGTLFSFSKRAAKVEAIRPDQDDWKAALCHDCMISADGGDRWHCVKIPDFSASAATIEVVYIDGKYYITCAGVHKYRRKWSNDPRYNSADKKYYWDPHWTFVKDTSAKYLNICTSADCFNWDNLFVLLPEECQNASLSGVLRKQGNALILPFDNNYLARSTDEGQSWDFVQITDKVSGTWKQEIVTDSCWDKLLYEAETVSDGTDTPDLFWQHKYTVFRSLDSGATWSAHVLANYREAMGVTQTSPVVQRNQDSSWTVAICCDEDDNPVTTYIKKINCFVSDTSLENIETFSLLNSQEGEYWSQVIVANHGDQNGFFVTSGVEVTKNSVTGFSKTFQIARSLDCGRTWTQTQVTLPDNWTENLEKWRHEHNISYYRLEMSTLRANVISFECSEDNFLILAPIGSRRYTSTSSGVTSTIESITEQYNITATLRSGDFGETWETVSCGETDRQYDHGFPCWVKNPRIINAGNTIAWADRLSFSDTVDPVFSRDGGKTWVQHVRGDSAIPDAPFLFRCNNSSRIINYPWDYSYNENTYGLIFPTDILRYSDDCGETWNIAKLPIKQSWDIIQEFDDRVLIIAPYRNRWAIGSTSGGGTTKAIDENMIAYSFDHGTTWHGVKLPDFKNENTLKRWYRPLFVNGNISITATNEQDCGWAVSKVSETDNQGYPRAFGSGENDVFPGNKSSIAYEHSVQGGNAHNAYPEDFGAVPQSRTINGLSLESNLILEPKDIGAEDKIVEFGMTWNIGGQLPESLQWQIKKYRHITNMDGSFAKEQFLIAIPAVASNLIACSKDFGKTWIVSTLPEQNIWSFPVQCPLASASSKNAEFYIFPKAGRSFAKAAKSTDGIEWSTIDLPLKQEWKIPTEFGRGFFPHPCLLPATSTSSTSSARMPVFEPSDGSNTWEAATFPEIALISSDYVITRAGFIILPYTTSATDTVVISIDKGKSWKTVTLSKSAKWVLKEFGTSGQSTTFFLFPNESELSNIEDIETAKQISYFYTVNSGATWYERTFVDLTEYQNLAWVDPEGFGKDDTFMSLSWTYQESIKTKYDPDWIDYDTAYSTNQVSIQALQFKATLKYKYPRPSNLASNITVISDGYYSITSSSVSIMNLNPNNELLINKSSWETDGDTWLRIIPYVYDNTSQLLISHDAGKTVDQITYYVNMPESSASRYVPDYSPAILWKHNIWLGGKTSGSTRCVRSIDGGNTWYESDDETENGRLYRPAQLPENVNVKSYNLVCFKDSVHPLIVAVPKELLGPVSYLLVTTDGAESWKKIPMPYADKWDQCIGVYGDYESNAIASVSRKSKLKALVCWPSSSYAKAVAFSISELRRDVLPIIQENGYSWPFVKGTYTGSGVPADADRFVDVGFAPSMVLLGTATSSTVYESGVIAEGSGFYVPYDKNSEGVQYEYIAFKKQ